MAVALVTIAILLVVASGLPGLCLSRSSVWSQRIAAEIMESGAIAGLAGARSALQFAQDSEALFLWSAAVIPRSVSMP